MLKRPIVAGALALSGLVLSADASANVWRCTKYDGGDWGYWYCDKGGSYYYTRIRCLNDGDGWPAVVFAYGDYAEPGIEASVAWCPDGFHTGRIRKFVVP